MRSHSLACSSTWPFQCRRSSAREGLSPSPERLSRYTDSPAETYREDQGEVHPRSFCERSSRRGARSHTPLRTGCASCPFLGDPTGRVLDRSAERGTARRGQPASPEGERSRIAEERAAKIATSCLRIGGTASPAARPSVDGSPRHTGRRCRSLRETSQWVVSMIVPCELSCWPKSRFFFARLPPLGGI